MNNQRFYTMSNQYYEYVVGVDEEEKLYHCYFLPKGETKLALEECRGRVLSTYPAEVYVNTNFEPLTSFHGTRFFHPACTDRARFVKKETRPLQGGKCHVFILKDDMTGLLIRLYYEVYVDSPAIRRYTEVENAGAEPVVISHITSYVLPNLPYYNRTLGKSDLYLHAFRSQWSFEADPEVKSFEELGLCQQGCQGGYTIESTSSWPCQKYFPYFVIEERKEKLFHAVQLEYSGCWRFEAGHGSFQDDNWYYIQGGMGNDLYAHWFKELAPGACFTSPAASLAVTKGSRDDVCDRMRQHQEQVLIHRSQLDQSLPVIYNDWMYMSGDVTEQRILEQLDELKKCGMEIYVTDAGWYTDIDKASPRSYWWDMVGCWEPDKDRLPHGLAYIAEEIRKRGMLPGIWCEIEAVGKYSPYFEDREMVMTRGRYFVGDVDRHFLNFTSPKARKMADEVFERLISYGFRYFKIDYNTDSVPGCDNQGEESLGQGLHAHRMAYYGWLDALRARHPDIIIENCSSGGMRLEYGMLSRTDLASVTDQWSEELTGGILYHALNLIHPSQCGMWSYLKEGISDERYAFILANSMLGRMHISGNVVHHPTSQKRLLKYAVSLYKHYRDILHHARVIHHTGDFHYYDNDTIRAVELRARDDKEAVISVARPKAKESEYTVIPAGLCKGKYRMLRFPSMKERILDLADLEKKGITAVLPEEFTAEIIHLKWVGE